MKMGLKAFFHKYYKHFIHAMNKDERSTCLDIIERMGLEETGYHWKGLVIKFCEHFGEVPQHIHNMMMLSESDARLLEYARRKERT